MEKVVLYSTGCPRCNVLKKKLSERRIEFEECSDVEEMRELGITTVPMLRVSNDDACDSVLDFVSAVQWVNAQEVRA